MPKLPCEIRLCLIDTLARRADNMASIVSRMCGLVAANGNMPKLQKKLEMHSLRSELDASMQELEYVKGQLHKHRASHAC